jgi:hypothetical protein
MSALAELLAKAGWLMLVMAATKPAKIFAEIRSAITPEPPKSCAHRSKDCDRQEMYGNGNPLPDFYWRWSEPPAASCVSPNLGFTIEARASVALRDKPADSRAESLNGGLTGPLK